ncbi:cation diffusion facilitator family transporter [Methanogenium organophilum]|uniref:Cation diffusion facilitator family transporter n=1 Tax=Methanogenium organophilum TaxID=2199 RepID=A0A9X9T772_METOG|nr:cation diffusion facilitator family transporter [Methanogenium organophilum]WAI00131.1 cation diffusion facilitator family transporter [Methanogenium organophilum]
MNYRRVRNTLILTFFMNLFVSLAKGIVGALAGSVSMVADAFHSLFDSVSNIVGLISIQIADTPPDLRHQYGHGKFETIGTMVVGSLLLITGFVVGYEGFGRFFSGTVPEITPVTVAVMLVTICVNITISLYERRIGKEENSSFLLADSQHTASDIFVSLSVLGGFVFIWLGYPVADAIIALGIAVLIIKMGAEILYNAVQVLTDASAPVDYDMITRIIETTEGVRSYHDFRCRGKPGEIFCDLHVVVDPDITVREGHLIGNRVRDRLKGEVGGVVDVIVHIDPYYGGAISLAAEKDTDKDTVYAK